MPSYSFAHWLLGSPISDSAAATTGHFGHAYRGWVGAPVVRVGSAQSAAASGGVAAGGSAVASTSSTVATASGLALGGTSALIAEHVVTAGGGLSAGGSRPANLASLVSTSTGIALGGSVDLPGPPYTTSGAFRYWRSGSPATSSASSPTNHFEHAFRGFVGFPVVSPLASQSYSATASGGLSLGGTARFATSWSAGSSGGFALGGSATISSSHIAEAVGGLSLGGRGSAGLSHLETTSGGVSIGGVRSASLAAVLATSGGAAFGGLGLVIEIGYHVYVNDGHGGPIDYTTPVATTHNTYWTSAVLDAPGSYKFGIRAFNSTGLTECNLDASARLELDADGADVTWVPLAPLGVRAIALAGGRVRVEWASPTAERRRRPTEFRVYAQAGALTDYTTPAAVAANTADLSGVHAVEIGPLLDGVAYTIGVRAANAFGEEQNTASVRVGADALPPSPLDSLQATPLARMH